MDVLLIRTTNRTSVKYWNTHGEQWNAENDKKKLKLAIKFTCKVYCKIFAAPHPTRKPSTASVNALTTWGDVSKMLGHTLFTKCPNESSHPKPKTPIAICLIAAHAVCLWTRSLEEKPSIGNTTACCKYAKNLYWAPRRGSINIH